MHSAQREAQVEQFMWFKAVLLMILAVSGFSTLAFARVARHESDQKRDEVGYQRKVMSDGLVQFRAVKDYGTSEFECEYTQEQCDEIEMEEDLNQKCALDGFMNCETTVRKRVEVETGDDYFFCGQFRKGQCVVSVQGSNSSSNSSNDEE